MTEGHPFNDKWVERFMALASHVAQWSKDPSTKVGCVLANVDRQVVGMGYNGFPRGVVDRPEWLEDRAVKYPLTIHAEENAVYNATGDVTGAWAFVTHAPCAPCTARLIQNGLSGVFYPAPEPGFRSRWAESMRLSWLLAASHPYFAMTEV